MDLENVTDDDRLGGLTLVLDEKEKLLVHVTENDLPVRECDGVGEKVSDRDSVKLFESDGNVRERELLEDGWEIDPDEETENEAL